MKAAPRLLVVDDHAEIVAWLTEELEGEGYDIVGLTSGAEALARARAEPFDLVIADVEMPDLRGPDLLAALLRERPSQLVLLITAFGSVDLAVSTVRAGAVDFVTKPFAIEALLLAVERALQDRSARRELVRLSRPPSGADDSGLVARSASMRRVMERAARAARATSTILLTGETGVGKGTVARFIHAASGRPEAPFVQVNCAAIPTHLVESELFGVRRGAFTDAREDREGLFARAHGGTLFLDEVGELPLDAQPKLLAVLETGRVRPLGGGAERTVDVRLIAATNRPLDEAVRERAFRADLLFRLDVIRLSIPPLRERPEDIDGLVDTLIDQLGARFGRKIAGLTAEAMAWLRSRPWPGNVRELANTLERAVALSEHDTLTLDDLTDQVLSDDRAPFVTLDEAAAAGAPLEAVELAYLRAVVRASGGNMSEAARRLGIDRRTLYRRLEEG